MSQTPNLSINFASIPNPPSKQPDDGAYLLGFNVVTSLYSNTSTFNPTGYAAISAGGIGGANHPQYGTAVITATTVPAVGGKLDTPVATKGG